MPISTAIHRAYMPQGGGPAVEIRRFDDLRLQSYVDKAIRKAEASGKKNAIFMNYNIEGEFKMGVSIRRGDHWSFGGFLEKKPGRKFEGMVEAAVAF